MRLKFIFSDIVDISQAKPDDLITTSFDFPDEALLLPDCHERILTIAQCVGQLTNGILHISCKELDLKHSAIKLEKSSDRNVIFCIDVMLIVYERRYGSRSERRKIKILLPADEPARNSSGVQTLERQKYSNTLNSLSDNSLALLTTEPNRENATAWKFKGYVPFDTDKPLMTLWNKRIKRDRRKERQREKEEQRRKAREEKMAQKIAALGKTPTEPPRTGAGRRIGAVPGIFMGVTFRSQLEIRFATELESRKIRWVYEGERLGQGQYLVDFYLPDLKCWVEVKGRVVPRDDYLLKEVADYLKRERGERLFMYTQSKAYRVDARQFRELNHDEFWSKL